MKKKYDESPFVRCPYYRCESSHLVHCEGVEKGAAIHMAFATPVRRKAYEKEFCKAQWSKCPVADVHNRRWGYVP